MCNHTATKFIITSAMLVMAFCGQVKSADSVFKCVKDGKVSYVSNPSANNGQCQQTVIRNDGPNPEDLARLLEQKKLRQEEENKAQDAALKEREIRAKEIEAAAATRRARAAEEELMLLRQTRQNPPPTVGYPYYYPYGGVLPGPIHTHPGNGINRHPSYAVPGQSAQPVPQTHPVPPTGTVRVR